MSALQHDAVYFVSSKELRGCLVILSIITNAVSALNKTTLHTCVMSIAIYKINAHSYTMYDEH